MNIMKLEDGDRYATLDLTPYVDLYPAFSKWRAAENIAEGMEQLSRGERTEVVISLNPGEEDWMFIVDNKECGFFRLAPKAPSSAP